MGHSHLSQHHYSVRNSPRQSANAEAFAEAYLHFIVFASAIKMPRQLNSQKLKKNSFPRTKKEIFCKRKKDFFHKKNFFTRHKLFMCIYIHYSYLHFVYFNSLLQWAKQITNHHLQMFLNYLELFTGFAEQFIMVLQWLIK